jgi:hypothetical protein
MNIIKNCIPQPEKSVKEIQRVEKILNDAKKKEIEKCIKSFHNTYKDYIKESTNFIKYLKECKHYEETNIISESEVLYLFIFGNVAMFRDKCKIPEKYANHLLVSKFGRGKKDRLETHLNNFKKVFGEKHYIIIMRCIDVYDSLECEKIIKNIAHDNDWIYYLKDNSGNAAYPELNPTEHIYTTRDELDILCNKYDEIGIQSKKHLNYLLTTNSNKVSDLKSNVLELKQQISVLNEEKEKSNDLSKENQELNEKVIVLEEKVNDKIKIAELMNEKVETKDKKIQKLKEKLIRKKEENKELKEENKELKEENIKLSSWTRNENNNRLKRSDAEYEHQEYVEKEF